jgi:endonuclease/exonuclease/phosphatase family metal-dependent hydrolase
MSGWFPRPNRLFTMLCGLVAALLGGGGAQAQARFKVVTYNLENYVLAPVGTREPKSDASRAKIREHLAAIRPDVLAVQEIGDTAALRELQAALKSAGVDLPHLEHVAGFDTNIFVGVLSRFPFAARRAHTNLNFLLNGRRFRASRGVAEVELNVAPGYRFTLFTTHLKSKRASTAADEAEIRFEEARLLRELVDARLRANPKANLVVCGDFNDTKDSAPTRALLGRGATALVDTRPVERNGDTLPSPNPRWEPRHVAWTHYYGLEDTYSRIDYVLLSPGMAREWRREGSYVFTAPNWGLASDHRPLVVEFVAAEQ